MPREVSAGTDRLHGDLEGGSSEFASGPTAGIASETQGKGPRRPTLRNVYDTFSEGFASADLTEARGLLESLLKRRRSSVLPVPARKPRCDLLEEPAVAVRIAERGIREIGATFRVRVRARKKTAPVAVEHLAYLDAAADEVVARCVDVKTTSSKR